MLPGPPQRAKDTFPVGRAWDAHGEPVTGGPARLAVFLAVAVVLVARLAL